MLYSGAFDYSKRRQPLIRLLAQPLNSLEDAYVRLQQAIDIEFATLPPYLYALYSIRPGTNSKAEELIRGIALQEMIHFCLDCNILNALGGSPKITAPKYPDDLGLIGTDNGPLTLNLIPFSKEAMHQGMEIEQPETPPGVPVVRMLAEEAEDAQREYISIGEFYRRLNNFLATLPASAWNADRNQISDDQFFSGQLFPVNSYAEAHKAIAIIVSEGEGGERGTSVDPLDFQGELSHYFRFGELFHDAVLTKADNSVGYTFGPAKLGVDWNGAYPAIWNPGAHDFSKEPQTVQSAQAACNEAFTKMVDLLQLAVSPPAGVAPGSLGQAVGAMFSLRMAAKRALTVPLADPTKVAGPGFLYLVKQNGGANA